MTDVPISAEARGLRRLWQTASRKKFVAMTALFDDAEVIKAAHKFTKANAAHYKAACVLQRAFQGCCTLDACDLKARRPMILWSISDASPETPMFEVDERKLTYDEKQATSSVHYVLAGIRPGLIRGSWSFSVTDHAIGRLIDRRPGMRGRAGQANCNADIDATIREGHLKLLAAPERCAPALVQAKHFLIPTTGGAWWATALVAKSHETGNNVLYVRCRSWFDEHMIHDNQRAEADELLTCGEGDIPIGHSLLHPLFLRQGWPPKPSAA